MIKAFPVIILALLVSAVACRFGMAPSAPTASPITLQPTLTIQAATFTPQPTATPLPTQPPSPTLDSCPDGNCVTACWLKLPPVVYPADQKARRASRPVKTEAGYVLVSYTVNGNQLENPRDGSNFPAWLKPFQQDRTSQRKIWDYFTALVPLEQRKYLAEYHVVSDGEDNNLAAVTQTETDMNTWALEVDIFDSANAQDLTSNLVHEFGHLLSLNPSQVVPSKRIFNNPDNNDIYDAEAYACKTYFPGEGCSLPESYINQFYQRFWQKIEAEWSAVDQIEDDSAYEAALDRFYMEHQDQFVSDYAVTDPGEDFSESFMVFILEPKPTGESIADRKVQFFYEIPELASLRTQIAKNLCGQLRK